MADDYWEVPAEHGQIILGYAKAMRKNPTKAEKMLWDRVRANKLGHKVYRQKPMGYSIPDFVFPDKRVIVELDGGYHKSPEMMWSDQERDRKFAIAGYKTLRFTNDEILQTPFDVADRIKEVLNKRDSRPYPFPTEVIPDTPTAVTSPLSLGEGPGERVLSAPAPLPGGEGLGNLSRQYKGTILLATVKGDVHDIGKNIVGVVLACNNYEIIDLGVMVPVNKILDEAVRVGADIIGLSGLITPSLDEMVTVASEMERRGMTTPLLIGGATTSKTHTALKVEPAYTKGATVHVLDASRAVTVASKLLDGEDADRKEYRDSITAEYERVRIHRSKQKSDKAFLPIAKARQNGLKLDWESYVPPVPTFTGTKVFADYDLAELVDYIDWTPFFSSWALAGKFPDILTDHVVGEEATILYLEAREMLDKVVAEKWVGAKAVIGFWPASADVATDTIRVTTQAGSAKLSAASYQLYHIRQQSKKAKGRPNQALTDFIAPATAPNKQDYIGAFAVTAGVGIEAHVKRFEEAGDDYSAIMLKALADRLAEALAERMHQRVRMEFWGYAPDEVVTNDQLIAEQYRGLRPAPGYPACPEHTEKTKIWELLDAENATGIKLTESMAMYPASSVSGWYLSHPEAKYFTVRGIKPDQEADYAQRKGWSEEERERWLAAIR
jgi:5-methyltetrahydrofolate--homocysteine methyltransferase